MMADLPEFTKSTEVAALSSGGKVLFATDDFFAAAEGMLKDSDPVFIADKYTEYGKWMDGWETRRKRTPGHDWSIVKLTGPTSIKGFLIDTAHYTGNFVPKISIQAALLPASADSMAPSRKPDVNGRAASNRDLDKIARLKSQDWVTLVPMTDLKPGREETRYHYIANTETSDKYTHVRLNLYPDGGIARFRVFGDIDLADTPDANGNVIMDMLSMQNGGRCLDFSDAHFGHPRNLNKPGRAQSMSDGWETARRLDRPAIIEMIEKDSLNIPGFEWAIFRLGTMSTISSIEVDTNHFKGNAAENVTIEGTTRRGDCTTVFNDSEWTVILDKTKLQAHKSHTFKKEIKNAGPFYCIRIIMAPDGGISRVRVFGQKSADKNDILTNDSFCDESSFDTIDKATFENGPDITSNEITSNEITPTSELHDGNGIHDVEDIHDIPESKTKDVDRQTATESSD